MGAIRYLYVVNLNLDIDNRSLVEQCLAGDRTALSLFYTRFAPAMLGIVSRYVPTRADAEDILHDGFVIAFTRLDSVRDYEHVDHWLATIMKNLSLQFLKNQDVSCLLHDTPEVADTPDIEDFIDIETLETLISKLPAGYQRVFRLAVLENKTHKEIADILGIAPNSSSSQLFHAKIMLRRLISDYKRQAGLLALSLLITTGIYLINEEGIREEPGQPERIAKSTIISPYAVKMANDSSEPTQLPSSVRRHTSHYVSCSGERPIITSSDSVDDVVDSVYPIQPDSLKEDRNLLVSNDSTPTDTPLSAQASADFEQDRVFDSHKHQNLWEIGAVASYGINDSKNAPYQGGSITGSGQITDSSGSGEITDSPDSGEPLTPAHHNDLPISASLIVSRSLSNRISLESGIVYTYLRSHFSFYDWESDCYWHYLGIPLKLNINVYRLSGVRVYATVGGKIDFPLYSKSNSNESGLRPEFSNKHFDSYISYSLSAGIGLSYRIVNNLDIFLEPTLQYRFWHKHEVQNYWTDNRWCFSLPVGFRFILPRK